MLDGDWIYHTDSTRPRALYIIKPLNLQFRYSTVVRFRDSEFVHTRLEISYRVNLHRGIFGARISYLNICTFMTV